MKKAMVLEKPGQMVLQEVKKPSCGPGDLLIKVRACNICRTDLKCMTIGQRDLLYPRVLGHEIAGVVIEKGNELMPYRLGQRVQVHPGIPCGECDYCKDGRDNLCDQIAIMGFNFDGGFQEIIRIPSQALAAGIINVIDNDELADEEISFIEPIACCVNILKQIPIKPQTVVVIIGGGRLGVLNLLVAKALGVKKVILVESNPKRREQGKALGFDAVFSGQEADLKEAIRSCTDGHGVDVVIPCCPETQALDLALELLRKKGVLGYFSGLTDQDEVKLDINRIHYKELMVVGSYGCSINHSKEAKMLLETGKIDVRPLISHRVRLEELVTGMEYIKNSDGYSTIVVMD